MLNQPVLSFHCLLEPNSAKMWRPREERPEASVSQRTAVVSVKTLLRNFELALSASAFWWNRVRGSRAPHSK